MDDDVYELVGVGLYTPAEAARLTGIGSARIRRWLRGYNDGKRTHEPIWKPQIDIGDGRTYLGFRDLAEVRVVDALAGASLPLRKIRRVIEIAKERYGFTRPLATNAFRTDGEHVLSVLVDEQTCRSIDSPLDRKAVWTSIQPAFDGLEFNEAGEPELWRIAPGVLVHPNYSFGQPVEQETYVPTEILACAVEAEGSPEAAAIAYSVSLRSVEDSLAFEEAFRLKRAA